MDMTSLVLVFIAGLLPPGVYSTAEGADNGYELLQRYKRSTTCEDKFQTIPDHSACLAASSKASNSDVSAADKTIIVDLHNQYRAAEDATNMLKVAWDDEVAMVAQKWVDQCGSEHDTHLQREIPGRLTSGQNLAWGTANWTAAVNLWQDERPDFTFGGPNDFLKVGHYTQIVWADSNRVGCGYAECDGVKHYACNYAPVGNVNGVDEPFIQGTKCADCTDHCSADNLCDCAEVCLNGGTMNRTDCTCECSKDYHTGTDCTLDCSLVGTEPDSCSSSDTRSCSNCPNTCYICPYADPSYVEGSEVVHQRPVDSEGAVAHGNVLLCVATVTLTVLTVRGL